MDTNNGWKKAGSNNGPKTDREWNAETEKTLQGTFMGTKNLKSKAGKPLKLHVVKDAEGKMVGAWGAAMLDRLMLEPAVGDEVKIVFVEKTYNKETDKYLKVFTVDFRTTTESVAKTEEKPGDKPADEIPF